MCIRDRDFWNLFARADLVALASSADIPKQFFLCLIANDKKVSEKSFSSDEKFIALAMLQLTMILHNAPDEPERMLTQYFSNLVMWANKRLNVLNIIMTQKMGLFRYRSFHHDQHSDFNRHHNASSKVRLALAIRSSSVLLVFSIRTKAKTSIWNK